MQSSRGDSAVGLGDRVQPAEMPDIMTGIGELLDSLIVIAYGYYVVFEIVLALRLHRGRIFPSGCCPITRIANEQADRVQGVGVDDPGDEGSSTVGK